MFPRQGSEAVGGRNSRKKCAALVLTHGTNPKLRGCCWMKLSCVWAYGLMLSISIVGTGAMALNAPHTLHRPRLSNPHLIEPRRGGRHAVTAHAARPAGRSTAARTSRSTARAASARAESAAPARRRVRGSAKATSPAALRRAKLSLRHPRNTSGLPPIPLPPATFFSGDVTAGEDPIVRQAAIDALDGMNGTAVVINPANGRILAMVNQKLALSPGAEPCSTIKLSVALAALSEKLVTRDHTGAACRLPYEHDRSHRP